VFLFVCLFVWSQIFVGKIPRDLFEDELVPLFEKAGPIWDLRLMMDPLSGMNRGYAFLTFCTKEAAQEAVQLVSPATGLGSAGLDSAGLVCILVLTLAPLPQCSAITTRSGPASTSASASRWPTTGCSSAPSPRARPRSRS